MKASDIGLSGSLVEERDSYVYFLQSSGIILGNEQDTLMWSWNQTNGGITIKKSYEAVTLNLPAPTSKWWLPYLWRWKIPQKLKVLSWLVLQNRILTGENIKKKGFNGPFICPNYFSEEETTHHFFMQCSYATEVWSLTLEGLNSQTIVYALSMDDAINGVWLGFILYLFFLLGVFGGI